MTTMPIGTVFWPTGSVGNDYRIVSYDSYTDSYECESVSYGSSHAMTWDRTVLDSYINQGSFSLTFPEGFGVAPKPTRVRPEPVYTETLKPHNGRVLNIPPRVIDEAIDRGERAVRRIGREWPWGCELILDRVEVPEGLRLEWRFERKEEQ